MAKFNGKQKTQAQKTRTVNRAGGVGYKESDKLNLISMMLTSFVKNQFYRKENESVEDMRKAIASVDPIFAAKAALFARNEYGMRSISHIAASEIANVVKGEDWTRRFFQKIVRRPDDMLEIMSLFMHTYGTKNAQGKFRAIPNAMKRGFSDVLSSLNEYKIAKYKGEGRDLSMIDLVRLVHPKRTKAIDSLYKGTLKPAETWEVGLTQAGQNASNETEKAEMKAKAWSDLVKEGKLGYMALLRNLRNILQQAPELVPDVCKQLVNKPAIKGSLVLPFRFPTAMEEIDKLSGVPTEAKRKVQKALEDALDLSFDNVPEFDGSTLVVVDYSGSMGTGLKSNRGIGSLFGVALAKKNDADLMIFGDDAKYLEYEPTMPIGKLTAWMDTLNSGWHRGVGYNVGHGTNMSAVFKAASKKKYNRIVIFSDMQTWGDSRYGYSRFGTPEAAKAYRKKTGADPHIYSVDLAGYGTLAFPENQVYALAGFSDKMFDMMKLLETDRNALINTIEKYDF